MAGFGRSRFGNGPFGKSDLGRDLVINTFPESYFDDTIILDPGESITDNDKDPLLMVLKTIAELVNNRRAEVDGLATLLDYEAAPLEIVRLWGDMLGLGIDKNDPEFLQRTFLGNASQWLQIKSSVRGYEIRGLANGFDVYIDNFWRIDPSYAPFIPLRHLFLLKPKTADASAVKILHTDVPPGTYAGTPLEEDETYAKASYIKIIFEIHEPRKPYIDYNSSLDLVIDKIREVVAIHHEIQAPEFRIHMNMSVPHDNSMEIHELSNDQVNIWKRYDIVAADVIPCDDGYPLLELIPTDEYSFSFGFTITSTPATFSEEFADVLDVGSDLDPESFDEEATFTLDLTPTVSMIIPVPSEIEMDMDMSLSMTGVVEEEGFNPFDVESAMTIPLIEEDGDDDILVNENISLEAQEEDGDNVNVWNQFDISLADEVVVDEDYPIMEDIIS